MQLSFLEAVTSGVTPTPARPPAHPKAPIDRSAHYRDWRDDLGWLETHTEELQVWFLFRHLRLLADPLVGPVERDDLLNWLCTDSMPPQPFSFTACARAYDPRIDPAALRDLLLTQLRRRGLQRSLRQAA